jgi:hypothetical protein
MVWSKLNQQQKRGGLTKCRCSGGGGGAKRNYAYFCFVKRNYAHFCYAKRNERNAECFWFRQTGVIPTKSFRISQDNSLAKIGNPNRDTRIQLTQHGRNNSFEDYIH